MSKKVNIIIHRGTQEIGGSCIEISTDDSRIFLDGGFPLDNTKSQLPENIKNSLGVFLSHGHLDHSGLLFDLPQNVPLYLGELTCEIMNASKLFNNKSLMNSKTEFLVPEKPVETGPFKITPFTVDHSIPDAMSFLIEVHGKRIYYTGDFRSHGRKGKLFHRLISKLNNIDVLITEGTTMGREDYKNKTESELETEMIEAINKEKGLVFLVSSAPNLDRIVTAYRAAKQCGRIFVTDIYTAYILDKISNFHSSTPRMEWSDIKILNRKWPASRQYASLKNNLDNYNEFTDRLYDKNVGVTLEEIQQTPEKYLIKHNQIKRLIKETSPSSSTIIYSLWDGYLNKEYNNAYSSSLDALQSIKNTEFIQIHSSGHADFKTIDTLIKKISPETILPVHTENPERFEKHYKNTVLLKDGEVFAI